MKKQPVKSIQAGFVFPLIHKGYKLALANDNSHLVCRCGTTSHFAADFVELLNNSDGATLSCNKCRATDRFRFGHMFPGDQGFLLDPCLGE